jgi:hypothetical protein
VLASWILTLKENVYSCYKKRQNPTKVAAFLSVPSTKYRLFYVSGPFKGYPGGNIIESKSGNFSGHVFHKREGERGNKGEYR